MFVRLEKVFRGVAVLRETDQHTRCKEDHTVSSRKGTRDNYGVDDGRNNLDAHVGKGENERAARGSGLGGHPCIVAIQDQADREQGHDVEEEYTNEDTTHGLRDVNTGVRDFAGSNGGDLDVSHGETGVDKSTPNRKETARVAFDEVFFDRPAYY
jgi:hypothetical protein